MTVVRDWQREDLKHYSHGAKTWQSHWLWWALKSFVIFVCVILFKFSVRMRGLSYQSWVDMFPDFISDKNWHFFYDNYMGNRFGCVVIGWFSIPVGLWWFPCTSIQGPRHDSPCSLSCHFVFSLNIISHCKTLWICSISHFILSSICSFFFFFLNNILY